MTQPTILDLYQDEEYLAIPGVAKGLLQSATPDNPDYRIVNRGDGTEGVFYRSKGGMQYLLGDRPRVIPVAPDPMTQQPGFGETSLPTFARGVAETGASVAKGVAQGFAGFPGDIESIGRGLLNNLSPAAMKRVQTSPAPFVRALFELVNSGVSFDKMLEGMDQDTALPTVKEVGEFIDGTGIMPEINVMDEEGVAPAELMGELLAPVTYVKSAKEIAGAVGKGVKRAKKAVTKPTPNNTIPPTQQEPM